MCGLFRIKLAATAIILCLLLCAAISPCQAEQKTDITGYGDFILGKDKVDYGTDAEIARLFAISEGTKDGMPVFNYDIAICVPYSIEQLNGHEVDIYRRPVPFKIGNWNTPDVECICEVYFVDKILAGVRLVFDYLGYSEDFISPDLRSDYAVLTAQTLRSTYDDSILITCEQLHIGWYCLWADNNMDELNLSYVEMSDTWLMTIRYTSQLYWDAYEGQSEASRKETESKL